MKLVILDRDGVINHDSENFIKSPEEWQPIDGSIEAIARLSKAGYTIAVATNQSGIARGYYDIATLNQMHDKMHSLVRQGGGKVDAVYYCPHGPDDGCTCRKPGTGMFERIREHFQQSLTGTVVIGDSLRDLEAADAMQCKPVLVRTGKGERTLEKLKGHSMDYAVYNDLNAAVTAMLEGEI